jgi:hypothetical protein
MEKASGPQQNIENSGSESEKLVSALESSLNQLPQNLELAKSDPKIQEKVIRVLRKCIKGISALVALGTTFAVVNYELTHAELTEKKTEKGITYEHPDQRTTHLLNVMAGADSLTIEDVLIDWRNKVIEDATFRKVELEKDAETMTLEDIDAYAVKYLKTEPGSMKEDIESDLSYYTEANSDSVENPELYDLVWQLEKECGNPKVRFRSEDKGIVPTFLKFAAKNSEGFKRPPHYDPLTNTLFVNPSNFSKKVRNGRGGFFISEMSHGKQFNDNQIGSYLTVLTDLLKTFKRGGFNMNKMFKEYKKMYDQPGSLEHGAHGVIEPYLKSKYKI